MSFDFSEYPIYEITSSLKEFFYSKEILPLNTEYLVKSSGKNIIFKSFKTGTSGTSNSISIKFNNQKYGFTILNVPKLYNINLGIEILENLTSNEEDFYIVDSKGNKVYMKFYIGIISTYGLNITNLDIDKFYHNTGMKLQLNIPNTNDNKLLLYSSSNEDLKFKSYIDYDGDNNIYETTVNGDIFNFEVRATEKDSSFTKSFTNSSYGWIIPLVLIGLIIFIICIYYIWNYFGNSMNIDKDSFDYPPELRGKMTYRYKTEMNSMNNSNYQLEPQESFPMNNSYTPGLSPMTPKYIPSRLPLTY